MGYWYLRYWLSSCDRGFLYPDTDVYDQLLGECHRSGVHPIRWGDLYCDGEYPDSCHHQCRHDYLHGWYYRHQRHGDKWWFMVDHT